MPAIACPNCKTTYNLEESFLGKSVKCRKCGSVFKAGTASAAPTVSVSSASAAKPKSNPNQAEFAKLGLQGPIASSPGLFDDAAIAPAIDPLANHVIYDPGFDQTAYVAPETEEVDPNSAYEDVLYNAAVVTGQKQKKKKDPLADYLTEEELNPTKQGKKNDTAQKGKTTVAAKALYWAGGLLLVSMVFTYFDYDKALPDLEILLSAEQLAEYQFWLQLVIGLGVGLGWLFLLLGALVPYVPITAISLGLILYVSFAVFDLMLADKINFRAIAFQVVILSSLGYGWWKAVRARFGKR